MTSRPDYRDPRIPRSVCVYTISQESRYLLIENIPSLGVEKQLIELCQSFGPIEECRMLDDHPSSTDTLDVLWVKYELISVARFVKKKLDNKPFYSNPLRVNYVPEYETMDDIRLKFQDRYEAVMKRVNNHKRTPKKTVYPMPISKKEHVILDEVPVPVQKKRRRI
ncbi:hypothetical protein BDB01DRAFT_846142 [Pilobolus umbonatus]|nr:hypothetical protein BDB01DRAFT_846142 [Pilobolus umbonatus]